MATTNASKSTKSTKKAVSQTKQQKDILLNNSVAKTYGLVDSKNQKYLQNIYENGIIKQITFMSFNQNALENTRIWQGAFDVIEGWQTYMREAAPIDIRLYVDSVEIVDNEEKANFLSNVIMVEQRSESKISLVPLRGDTLRATKLEAAAKAQLQTMVSNLQRKLQGLSMTECNKLKNALNQ